MHQGLVGVLALIVAWTVAPALATVAPSEAAMGEKVLGRDDAPVTMIEYSSLTCPHCAAFHRDTLPKIKETYIDTGKVKLVFRDFPLGSLALAAAMLARCADGKKYFGMLEVLFRSQETWARANNPIDELGRVARFGGLSTADVNACLSQEALMQAIQSRAATGQDQFKIDSTPTFVIDGKVVKGALPFEEFKKILDKAIASKQ